MLSVKKNGKEIVFSAEIKKSPYKKYSHLIVFDDRLPENIYTTGHFVTITLPFLDVNKPYKAITIQGEKVPLTQIGDSQDFVLSTFVKHLYFNANDRFKEEFEFIKEYEFKV